MLRWARFSRKMSRATAGRCSNQLFLPPHRTDILWKSIFFVVSKGALKLI
jgi:hypothetical protein